MEETFIQENLLSLGKNKVCSIWIISCIIPFSPFPYHSSVLWKLPFILAPCLELPWKKQTICVLQKLPSRQQPGEMKLPTIAP